MQKKISNLGVVFTLCLLLAQTANGKDTVGHSAGQQTDAGSPAPKSPTGLRTKIPGDTPSNSDLLQACARADKSPEPQAGSAALSLQNFLTRYKNEVDRKQAGQQYIDDLKRLLEKTPSGPELIRCYEALDKVRTPIKYDPQSPDFHHEYGPAAGDPSKNVASLSMNFQTQPEQALIFFASVMQTTCSADTHATRLRNVKTAEDLFNQSKPGLFSPSEERLRAMSLAERAQTQFYQHRLVNELKGFRTQVQIFKELASINPQAMCSFSYHSGLREKQVTLQEHLGDLEMQMKSGTFVQFILPKILYGGPDYEDVYVMTKTVVHGAEMSNANMDSQGQPILRPEFRRAVENAGFSFASK